MPYGQCCAPRGVKWTRGANGVPYRTVKIPRELRPLILEQPQQHFQEIFRRAHGKYDLFSPLAYTIDEEELQEEFTRAAEKVGVDPALIYATRKTGRVLVRGLTPPLPQRDLDEWEDAIEEYYEHEAQTGPLSEADEAIRAVMNEAVRLPFIFGKLLYDVNKRAPAKLRSAGFRSVFSIFCAARTTKSLQAIRALVETQAAEDTLTIVRSMYEGYLHCIGAMYIPEELERVQVAKAGVVAGTHAHPMNAKGRTDYRLIENLATGERLKADISVARLASISPHPEDLAIYHELYGYLSRYAHPHVLAIPQFLTPEGFTSKSRELAFEAFLLGTLVACMVLDALAQLPLPQETRADVRRFLKHARLAFRAFFCTAHADQSPSRVQLSLEHRAARLGERWVPKPAV